MKRLMNAVILMLGLSMVIMASCTKDPNNNGGNNGGGNGSGNVSGGTEEGLYLGIIGFNDQLSTKPLSLLKPSTEDTFIDFVDALNMRDGTALYHAVNTALNWLKSASLPSELINVSIVTFTDGLDNASTMLNSNYGSQAEFLNAVNRRILNDRVGGQNINAYAIGMKGNDVQDQTSFQQNLRKLSSSPSNVFEVDNMENVTERFRSIAGQLYNETSTPSMRVKIPGGYDNNTVIRITFDDVSSCNASNCYVEGTYTRVNGQGRLDHLNYRGLQSTSGNTVVSESQDGAYYWYKFVELKTQDGQPVTNTSNMRLWRYVSSTQEWQPESEFSPSNYSDIQVDRKSAVVILVLDCTTSLGIDFRHMKEAAKQFVEVLDRYGNTNGGGNGGDIPTNNIPSISVYQADGFLSNGDVLNLDETYQYGFVVSSEVGLSSLDIRVEDEEFEFVELHGETTYIYTGDVTFSYDWKEIIGECVFTAIATDIDGRTNTATLHLYLQDIQEPLDIVDFEWYRQNGHASGLDEYGLYWHGNYKDETKAHIKPLEGVTLYSFNSSAWDATITNDEKEALFANEGQIINEYNNVSVMYYNSLYDDVIGTAMPDGTLHLIHVTRCIIETGSSGPRVYIYGESK